VADDVQLALLDVRDALRYASQLDLRYRVLRRPIGLPRETVAFAGEAEALHVVAVAGDEVVGCVLFDLASGRLRAMAVDPAWQRAGLGARLVRRLETELTARGVGVVSLHARADVVGFYERLGYAVHGGPFVEVGLAHRGMRKTLR